MELRAALSSTYLPTYLPAYLPTYLVRNLPALLLTPENSYGT